MGDKTAIEWTDATWNPVSGCSKVSPGCAHCYAERVSHRYGFTRQPWTAEHAAENVVLHPDRLEQPLHWRKPKRIFVNSMSDLFHEQVPDSFIDRVFGVMAMAPEHIFQVLTKRPERMQQYISDKGRSMAVLSTTGNDEDGYHVPLGAWDWPLPNAWLGVSAEYQRQADERIPLLLQTPAAVRFVSLEPLLGPIDLHRLWGHVNIGGSVDMCLDALTGYAAPAWGGRKAIPEGVYGRKMLDGLDWVIAGGETQGPRKRHMKLEWAASLRDQCVTAGVPFFFKQVSGSRPGLGEDALGGAVWHQFPTPLSQTEGLTQLQQHLV